MMSFLNIFSGYVQIKMDPTDEEKTFYHRVGTYYYKDMPFELKNAWATY